MSWRLGCGQSSDARPGRHRLGVLAFDDIEIDLERRMVTRDGQLVQLSGPSGCCSSTSLPTPARWSAHGAADQGLGPEYRDDLQYLRSGSAACDASWARPRRAGSHQDVPGIGYLLDIEGVP